MSETKEIAVAEQPQQLITIEPSKYVELVFEPFAKRLADAKTLAEAATFDVTTTAGMAVAVKHRATFREIRVSSEKARKERKAPILEIGKLLDSRQKEIEAEIEPFESRFDSAIKAEEARKVAEKQAKAAAEKARVDGIKARIEAFMLDAVTAATGTAAEIDAHATKLSEMIIDLEGWQEFAGEAQVKRDNTVKWLRERQQQAAEREAEQARLAEERAQLERDRAAQAERERVAATEREAQEKKDREAAQAAEAERKRIDGIRERIAAIKATVAMQAGKSSTSIESAISALETMELTGFDGFLVEANSAVGEALAQLREMHASVLAMEQAQAELARQQRELARQKAEQERIEREAREAAEAKARADKLEADHIEALTENARIDAERAETKRKEDEQRAAEAERIRREAAEFESIGPEPDEIIDVLAQHYDVTAEVARHWLTRHSWMALEIAA